VERLLRDFRWDRLDRVYAAELGGQGPAHVGAASSAQDVRAPDVVGWPVPAA
jgi:hypothetical protein